MAAKKMHSNTEQGCYSSFMPFFMGSAHTKFLLLLTSYFERGNMAYGDRKD